MFLTVKKREGLVRRLIGEIKMAIEDCRSNTVGGILVGNEI